MKIGTPRLIFDLYEWLPSDGESKVSFRSVGPDLVISVEFEKEDLLDGNEIFLKFEKEIVFKFARYVIKTPFPGEVFFDYDKHSEKPSIGALNEFIYSDFASSVISAHHNRFGDAKPNIKHFSVQFLSANLGFHVLAEDVFLTEESLLD